jgi:hypothetical protein
MYKNHGGLEAYHMGQGDPMTQLQRNLILVKRISKEWRKENFGNFKPLLKEVEGWITTMHEQACTNTFNLEMMEELFKT